MEEKVRLHSLKLQQDESPTTLCHPSTKLKTLTLLH